MNETYDLVIIGAGVAGSFASLKIAKDHKYMKTLVFELGRPMGKRRQQINGWLGILPNSDGKLYASNLEPLYNLMGDKKTKSIDKWFKNYTDDIYQAKLIKDKSPSINATKRIEKAGFEIELNNHMQLYPKDIHALSKHMSNAVLDAKNITFKFDDEVISIAKQKSMFTITSSNSKITCKKLIMCAGRSGWRWARDIYNSFDIIKSNDVAKFGIRAEISAPIMKHFNYSNCSMTNENIEIGPLCWNGTVIPEDHMDFAIASFRSNEARWKTDKVSFNIIGSELFPNNGVEQINRIGQLTFLLSNDRVAKEKISTIMNGKSRISVIPEYKWLTNAIQGISEFIPDIMTKGYFHVPTILPLIPTINVSKELETDVDNMYCAGESSGHMGLLSAIITGVAAADFACK